MIPQRLVRIVRDALCSVERLNQAGRAHRGRSRTAGAGVFSGWIGPDGRVEEGPGTALHVALLARFSEPTKDSFFKKGAIRYVDEVDDHLSLEFVGDSPVALSNAIAALTDRWGDRVEVYLEFLGTLDSILGSAAEVRQDLSRRLSSIYSD
jgi:hypothetical protein